jgi:hypothetical protein
MDNKFKNIKNSSAFYSKIPNYKNQYSDIVYGCSLNKICFIFSPRSGCSVSFKNYLDFVGLIDDSIYDDNVHDYRINYFLRFAEYKKFDEILLEKYEIIKTITNPYSRAVSIFKGMINHNLNFEDFLLKLQDIHNDKFLSDYEIFHTFNQYSDGEEKYITKYFKIDKKQNYEIKLSDNRKYIFNPNNYNSEHHAIRFDIEEFLGNTKIKEIKKIPKFYKYFYNNKIKMLVDNIYGNDIKKYNYSFEETF